ncbi:MAG TPA: molybdate-binding protein, partial [Blastococcus sp.]
MRFRLALLAAATLLGVAACSGSAADTSAAASRTPTEGSGEESLTGRLTVFAAASLTDVFTELGNRLEA